MNIQIFQIKIKYVNYKIVNNNIYTYNTTLWRKQ